MTTQAMQLVTVAVRDDGCFSALLDFTGRPFAVTVEHTFDDGRPIIRNGRYLCKKPQYYKGWYPTFEILVEGHSRILFHKANRETDVIGCIGVAESFGMLGGLTAVLNSNAGFTEFWSLAKDVEEFYLVVSGR